MNIDKKLNLRMYENRIKQSCMSVDIKLNSKLFSS